MKVQFVGESNDGISVSSHHAKALAAAGVEVCFEDPSYEPKPGPPRPDIIHVVTFHQTSNALVRQLVAARMAGTQIVRYWTGRDVIWARHHAASREMAKAMQSLGSVQLCRTPEIAASLSEIGIHATPLPVISSNISGIAQPRALPSTFTALCYLPEHRFRFHGGDIIRNLIDRVPSVRFLILGGGGREILGRENVECLWDSTDSVRSIQRSTVFVDARLDEGLSRLALESLCHGRHVISGFPLPHAFQARTIDEFVEALRTLRQDPAFNLAGRSFVNIEHDYFRATHSLRRALEEAAEPGRLNLALEGGLRSAAAAWKNPQLLSHRAFGVPAHNDVPEDACAMRALLRDLESEAQPTPV